MKKLLGFWRAVLLVVIGVELLLGYFAVPVANLAVVGIAFFATVLMVLFGGVIFLLFRDREQERRVNLVRDEQVQHTHRETVRVLGFISLHQQMLLQELVAQGARLGQLPSGEFSLIKPDGTYARLTDQQANYLLENEG